MKTALIFIETKNNELKKSSLESLSALQGTGYQITTCALGSGADQIGDSLSQWGVTQHFSCTDEPTKIYNPEIYQQFFTQVFNTTQPNLILASSNNLSRDVFPRLAAHFDAAYMNDVTEITISPEFVVKRPMYAGKCMTLVNFKDDSTKIILLRPNQIPVATPSQSTSVQMQTLTLEASAGLSQTVSIEEGQSEKLDLTEASTIVSGGRGLKEADNFKLLNDLADPLNATVGASRAVVDLGWVPHSLQVGQTGKTVAPNLYFAVGISGAIQHLAGMSGSKNVVAINKDEKAPIFQKSTYGVVGDLFEIVPLLTEKLKTLS